MNICLFYPDEISKPLPIRDERARHIVKILHKKEGDVFSAGIINGPSGSAKITGVSDDCISFEFTAEGNGKPLYPLKMIVGFPRPIQLKRLLRDIAALGVCQVHLTGTELGEKSYMKSNLAEHKNAYSMLVDGTVQAAGTQVPELFLHENLKDCLEFVKKGDAAENSLKICLDNINPSQSLAKFLESNKSAENSAESFIAAVGSERGWTEKERRMMEESGFTRCGMGRRVMRTETAATVSASVISAFAGWLEC